MNQQNPFKWRHFESEIIVLCVRWYLRYALSYRDLEEMMLERGLQVDHTTIYRWVQQYVPNWRNDAGRTSKLLMTPGALMKPTSRSKERGRTFTERSIRKATRSSFS